MLQTKWCHKCYIEFQNQIANISIFLRLHLQICNIIVGKREVGKDIKLDIFKEIYLPTLLCGSESCVNQVKHLSWITTAEIRFLRRRRRSCYPTTRSGKRKNPRERRIRRYRKKKKDLNLDLSVRF